MEEMLSHSLSRLLTQPNEEKNRTIPQSHCQSNGLRCGRQRQVLYRRSRPGAQITVPEQPPFVFVAVGTTQVEIFLNKDEPASPAKPGGVSLYVELKGLDQLLAQAQERKVKIESPLHETFYGMREFAVLDPNGYLLIFAERIAKKT